MGHESQIELWLTPNDHVPLCWFQNQLASLRRSNEKPLTKENPNRWATPATEYLVWKVRTDPAQSRGLEARKTPAVGEVFFLDFPFYRTNQALTPDTPSNTASNPAALQIVRYFPIEVIRQRYRGFTGQF
jgi:hypothetical protein